jgi:hypothetical protein
MDVQFVDGNVCFFGKPFLPTRGYFDYFMGIGRPRFNEMNSAFFDKHRPINPDFADRTTRALRHWLPVTVLPKKAQIGLGWHLLLIYGVGQKITVVLA